MLRLWPFRPKTFLVTKAEPADLQKCADIHANSFTSNWRDGELAQMLLQKNTQFLVAKLENKSSRIAGFLVYRSSAKETEVLTIATDPEFRQFGAGTCMMEQMIRDCLSDRIEEIFLEVEASNQPALRLYRKLGFEKVGERKNYYRQPQTVDDKTETSIGDAYIMRLSLLD